MEQYCIYLRKSRADIELEAKGEMETLSRHKKILLELGQTLKLPVTKIYEEIVSGETIESRPVVRRLLDEVGRGIWRGVLVMEIERLARGDTVDQGIVARMFKLGRAKIITPVKIYDPENEFDEEYLNSGSLCQGESTNNKQTHTARAAYLCKGGKIHRFNSSVRI